MSIAVSSCVKYMNRIELWIHVDLWTTESAIIAINVNSAHVDDWTIKRPILASNVNSVCVDDWTAKRLIIASNVNSVNVDDWTIERAIITSNVIEKLIWKCVALFMKQLRKASID